MDFVSPPPDMDDWDILPPPDEPWLEDLPTGEPLLKHKPAPAGAKPPAVIAEQSPAPLQAVPSVVEPSLPASVSAAPAPVLPEPHRVADSLPPAGKFMPFNYLVPPETSAPAEGEPSARMVQVILRSCGSKERDIRRLRRIHGLLRSSPGKDRFSFMIFENDHFYMIEFPNETTGITPDLIRKLTELVGADNFRLEPLQIH
jgi:DNA polymerase-3 subunit alpha